MQYVIAPWYSVDRPNLPRIIDPDYSNFKYPGQWSGIHDPAGRLWASTLVDVEERAGYGMGRDITTKLLLESFHYTTNENLVYDQVQAIFKADKIIPEYSGSHLKSLGRIFFDRGFFDHDLNFQNNHIYAGDITSNKTISTIGWINSDIRIKSGVTVTVSPNTFLFLNNNSKIIVESGGSIVFQYNATGGVNIITYDNSEITVNSGASLYLTNCYVQPGSNFRIMSNGYCFIDGLIIAGSQSWSGIIINGSGANNSVIKNSTIKNVTTYGGSAISVNGSTGVIINNCTITNNINYGTNGIGLTNAGSPNISYNTISNNGGYGIYYYNTNGDVWKNTVQNNPYGGVRLSNSSPNFGHNGFYAYNGNNVITGGSYGIYADYYSYPYVGSQFNSYYGYNSIYSNTIKRVRASLSEILAEQHWWGSSAPPASWFEAVDNSIIEYTPWLTSPPGEGQQSPSFVNLKNSFQKSENILTALDSVFDEHWNIRQIILDGNPSQAADILHKLLSNGRDEKLVDKLLIEFIVLMESYSEDDNVQSLFSVIKDRVFQSNIANILLARLYSITGEKTKAIKLYRTVKGNDHTKPEFKFASLNEFYENLQDNNILAAKQNLADMKNYFACDFEIKVADWLFESLTGTPEAHIKKDENSSSIAINDKSGIELGNYPNPFNPVTRISYTVTSDGKVSLKVFDVLGREVTTLINDFKYAGTYNVQFNASSLSSGLYFYRLEHAGKVLLQKMLLTK